MAKRKVPLNQAELNFGDAQKLLKPAEPPVIQSSNTGNPTVARATVGSAPRDAFALNDEQRAALTLNKNRIISASAGTGKTHTLTALYLGLLCGRLRPGEALLDEAQWLTRAADENIKPMLPGEIVAVTFTRKAAAELLERAREGLAKELNRSGLPKHLASHLQKCWEQLPGAPVTTIDAYCARLLREAGARSPAPSGFSVLEQDEAAKLQNESFTLAAAEMLEANSNLYLELLAREWQIDTGYGGLLPTARGLFESLRVRGIAPLALKIESPAAALDEMRASLLELFAKVLTVKASKNTEKLVRFCKTPLPMGTHEEMREAIICLSELFYTGKGEMRVVFTKAGIEDPRLCDLLDGLHAPFVNALLDFIHNAAERYSQSKRAANAVDFNDLLHYTRELVKVGPFHSDCSFMLIDEYQDTNPLQNAVLRSISKSNAVAADARLAVVGDCKQSIYRFRGADVQLMTKCETDSDFALASLCSNFRSRRPVIQFLNAFFETVWPTTGDANAGIVYDERQHLTEAGTAERHGWSGPAAELLVLDGDPPKAELHRWQQARVIAQRIGALVNPVQVQLEPGVNALIHPQVWDKKEGCLRAPRYGDIAILARGLKSMRIQLQLALGEMNIPFRMLGGVSFYTRQEVLDTLNLLACAADGSDELSLFGLLRSPFVSLSDGAIWRLQRERQGQTLIERIGTAAAKPQDLNFNPADALALQAGARLIENLCAARGRKTAAEIIDAACQQTGFLSVLAMQPQGHHAVASVRRVIELSREYESKGARHLMDFVSWLKAKADAEWDAPAGSGDAASDVDGADENVVRIGTVHSAKGLEFPIVIAADLGAQPKNSQPAALLYVPTDTALTPRLGLSLGVEHKGLKAVRDSVHLLAAESEKNADDAETRRLLYVALTRARDYLILIGETGKRAGGEAIWRRLLDHFFLIQPGAVERVHYHHAELAAVTAQPVFGLIALDSGTPELLALQPAMASAALRAMVNSDDIPVALRRRDVRISVSQLSRWLACPRRMGFDDLAGPDVPPVFAEADSIPDSTEDLEESQAAPDIRELGTAAHAALETLFSGGGDVADAWAQAASALPPSTENGEVQARLDALLKSEWGRATRALAPEKRMVEKAFRLVIKVDAASASTVTLIGKIDLLSERNAGHWQVCDYKLAEPSTSGDSRLRYAWQCAIYALVAAEIMGLSPNKIEPALIFLKTPDAKPTTLKELGFPDDLSNTSLSKILAGLWESVAHEPSQRNAHVWQPLTDSANSRTLKECTRDSCPYIQKCFSPISLLEVRHLPDRMFH